MRTTTPSPLRPSGKAEAGSKQLPVAASAMLAVACALLGSALSGKVAAQPAPNARIGYVDMQRLLDNAPQVIAARASLQREFAQRDSELKTQEAQLVQLESTLRRDQTVLPKTTTQARELEIDTLRRSIERTRTRLRDELNARAKEELNERWNQMHDVVVEFARERNYDLVVQSPVIYASAAVDITDAVLERLQREAAPAAPK